MPQDFGLGLKSRKKNSECMIISVKRKKNSGKEKMQFC